MFCKPTKGLLFFHDVIFSVGFCRLYEPKVKKTTYFCKTYGVIIAVLIIIPVGYENILETQVTNLVI